MASATAVAVTPRKIFSAKYVVWIVYAVLTVIVIWGRDLSLLDPNSFLRQRYAPIPWFMFLHGIPGVVALVLGVFQFSNRLRAKYIQMHRVMGRIYVGSVFIAAPLGIVVALKLPTPTFLGVATLHATGWLLTTATALYCVKVGKIQQHKEWMIRSYPLAMAFIVARAVLLIPAVERAGLYGSIASVWWVIAAACFLPSFVIEWQKLMQKKPVNVVRAVAGD